MMSATSATFAAWLASWMSVMMGTPYVSFTFFKMLYFFKKDE